MKIAICDDDKELHKEIEDYCKKYCLTQISLLNYFSGEELLDSIEKGERIELLFLDIKMEGLGGEETCRQIREKDSSMYIVFTTSLMEYAIVGYELSINDFLLKPMTEESFQKVFNRAMVTLTEDKNVFSIKSQGKILPFSSIYYIEALGRKLRIVTEEGTYEIYGNITQEEEQLQKYGFMRVHRSYLVNISTIDQILTQSIWLKNKKEIPISRRKYKEIYDSYTDLLFGKYQEK